MIKKIFKTIAFLSMAMCIMLSSNVVYATKDGQCPRDTHGDGYSENWKNWQGTDFRTFYYHHDETKILADEQNKIKENTASATGVIVPAAITAILALSGVGAPMAAVGAAVGTAGTALGNLIFKTIKTDAQKWYDSSSTHNNCGVKVHYYRSPVGTWHYHGFDPQ